MVSSKRRADDDYIARRLDLLVGVTMECPEKTQYAAIAVYAESLRFTNPKEDPG